MLGLCDLLQQPQCSPNGLSRFLGLPQWFFQLQRRMFSILNRSYAFARLDAPNEKRTLPPGCNMSCSRPLVCFLCSQTRLTDLSYHSNWLATLAQSMDLECVVFNAVPNA